MYGEIARIERQKLYDEVWSTPMSQLATRYAISDVGLAKICRKLGIPVPGRGYWQKIKSGKRVRRVSLPPIEEGQRDCFRYRRSAKPASNDEEQVHIDSEKLPENLIVVEDMLAQVHPLVVKTMETLLNAQEDNSGLFTGRDQGCLGGYSLDIKVGKGSLDRAFRIMDALLKALDRRGEADDEGQGPCRDGGLLPRRDRGPERTTAHTGPGERQSTKSLDVFQTRIRL